MATFNARICIRRDTAANFTSADPTLALGEIAYETDTRNIKVGDGATAWTALPYINPFRGGNPAAPTSTTVLGSGAGISLQSTGIGNTIIGDLAGDGISTGDYNTIIGERAGRGISTGQYNVAVGSAAFNTGSGNNNVAIGQSTSLQSAAFNNTVAVGQSALSLNTASNITAVGANALDANTTGVNNVAVGKDALGTNTSAAFNVAVGTQALNFTSTGGNNTAVGTNALQNNTTQANNTAVGINALQAAGASNNTAIGASAGDLISTGAQNTIIGSGADPSANSDSNSIVIGYNAVGNGSNTTTIGNSSTTGTFIPAGNLTLSNTGGASDTGGLSVSAGGRTVRVQATDGAFGEATIGTYTNHQLVFKTNSTYQAQLTTSGNFVLPNGNLVIGTSGKGIDFSATSEGTGTMTSELLSDYEEGTWTPSVAFGGASVAVTYAAGARVGRYTKIGRAVTITCYIALSNKGSSTGSATITGLPFTVGQWCSVSIDPGAITFTGQIGGLALEADSTIALKECSEAGTRTDITDADFGNSSSLTMNLTYTV